YREAAERAAEALAGYRESAGAVPAAPPPAEASPASPLRGLTRTLERFRGATRPPRQQSRTETPPGTPPGAESAETPLPPGGTTD
ncbi:hypothetical protein ACFTXB_26650, partial [Streptomyces sp. NPDC057074]